MYTKHKGEFTLDYLLFSFFILSLVLGEIIGLYIHCENCYYLENVKRAVIFVPIIKAKMFWKYVRLSIKRKSIIPILSYIKTDNKGLRILVKLAKIKENCKTYNS